SATFGRCFFSSRRRHTRFSRDWSSDVCSSDLEVYGGSVHGITVDLNGEHAVHIDGFDEVFITPVETQITKELHAGIWEVGKDIEIGRASCRERVERSEGAVAHKGKAGADRRQT